MQRKAEEHRIKSYFTLRNKRQKRELSKTKTKIQRQCRQQSEKRNNPHNDLCLLDSHGSPSTLGWPDDLGNPNLTGVGRGWRVCSYGWYLCGSHSSRKTSYGDYVRESKWYEMGNGKVLYAMEFKEITRWMMEASWVKTKNPKFVDCSTARYSSWLEKPCIFGIEYNFKCRFTGRRSWKTMKTNLAYNLRSRLRGHDFKHPPFIRSKWCGEKKLPFWGSSDT